MKERKKKMKVRECKVEEREKERMDDKERETERTGEIKDGGNIKQALNHHADRPLVAQYY